MSNTVLKAAVDGFFRENKIEFYSVLSYSDVRVTAQNIMDREAFTPRSVIVFLLPYYTGECENLSVYSASLDYHIAIRDLTSRLVDRIQEVAPAASAKGYGDHSPIDERHAAISAGLGILGKSGLIINEKYGTYVFVADLITDIEPELFGATAPLPLKTCHGCGLCLKSCPTGILRGEGEDCLSAITQRKGELTESEISLMREYNTVWGCDICQSVCPYNLEPIPTPIDFFFEERIPLLTTELLLSMDKASFSRRAFAWRGRRTVERNLELLGY